MRQLSALDAWLLDREPPTSAGHVGTLVTVDPRGVAGDWGAEQLRALLEARLHTVAALRERLVSGPWGLGGWYLADDPDFDLEFHVRELGLSVPGTTQQLAELVAGIHARPLDRGRPMWELYVISGREDGLTTVYAKVHRTLLDEVAGDGLLHALLDPMPEPASTPPGTGPVEPGAPAAPELLGHSLRSFFSDPRQVTHAVPTVLHRIGRLSAAAGLPGAYVVEGLAQVAGRLLGPRMATVGGDVQVPRTRLDAPLTAHRRIALGSVPVADVTRVAHRLEMTTDDVMRTASATALRRWFLDHDALPDLPVVAAVPVPVPVPAGEQPNARTVRTAPVPVVLPTHLRDPAERAQVARDSMRAAIQGLDDGSAGTLEEVASEAPLRVQGLAARTLSGLALGSTKVANITVSHALGPSSSLFLAGAQVAQIVPLAAVGPATGGLGITSYSHAGGLHIALTVCREIVPDVGHVLDYLLDGLAELEDLAG